MQKEHMQAMQTLLHVNDENCNHTTICVGMENVGIQIILKQPQPFCCLIF